MTNIKFYEARKKEARVFYSKVVQIPKENLVDVEQVVRSATRFSAELDQHTDDMIATYTMVEWYRAAMPFYRVYPAFQKQLSALGEDFLDNFNAFDFDIGKSLKAIAIEFPISDEPIHACELMTVLKKGPEHTKPDLFVYSNLWFKERCEDRHTSNVLSIAFGLAVAGGMCSRHFPISGVSSHHEVMNKALRTYAAIIAIGDNPDLLQPIPLSKDRSKYEETLDAKYIMKAKRRGVFGFEVGKIFEEEEQLIENIKRAGGTVAPHYRKSHLAWQPHGPENSLRKLILRKGALVNFEKAQKVPMGYYGEKENAAGS